MKGFFIRGQRLYVKVNAAVHLSQVHVSREAQNCLDHIPTKNFSKYNVNKMHFGRKGNCTESVVSKKSAEIWNVSGSFIIFGTNVA